ncbi:MAG: type II toxin-antitoxin system VapC family toxin [Pseudomonadota bacterium]|nr:type II toxin-antitoxin system VapC family toxin [Pseudomonadota bacterium]
MSSGYLLDTSVLSLLAPDRPASGAALTDWLRVQADALNLSAITVAEIEQGICKLRRAGGRDRAGRLTDWLDALLAHSADRVLAFDARVGRLVGALSDRALAAGRHPGFPDIAIAATAMAHGLVLLTRNGRHFEALSVDFADPFDAAASGAT